MVTTTTRPAVFAGKQFLIRQKVFGFTLASLKYYIEDGTGNTVGFFAHKLLKLKDDIRVFADDTMTRELLQIKARSILDFSVAFDVIDSGTGERIGGIKRRGWKSLVKDEWILMDPLDNEIGRIHEDSPLLATVRRLLTNLIPQSYNITFGGDKVGHAKQNWNPFAPKLSLDFSTDFVDRLDRRLGIAAGVLLIAIEGRQR
ncbi:MAG TPA: hypothetical protein VD837_11190 [Terriglobales bacterium]|nr:hypothetical protein [Terriglobales bacterium]